MQNGQLELAERDFRGVIALDPKSATPHINLGVTYMRGKRWDDALVELRKAELLAPDEPGIQLNIGFAYYRRMSLPWRSYHSPQPCGRHRIRRRRHLLGLCYFFTNKYKEAADTLDPLWEKESTKLNYLYVLSIAASKSSNPVLQKQAFDQMLAIGQNTPEFHLYVGKAWLAEDERTRRWKNFAPPPPRGRIFPWCITFLAARPSNSTLIRR